MTQELQKKIDSSIRLLRTIQAAHPDDVMEIEATVRYQTREEALNDGILKALEML